MAIGDFFRRVLIPVRQRPSSEDLNALQWSADASVLGLAGSVFGASNTTVGLTPSSRYSSNGPSGFYAGGFWCVLNGSSPPFGIQLNAGTGFSYAGPVTATDIDSAQGADWGYEGQWGAPLVLSETQTFTVPAPPAVGSSRIDIIAVTSLYLATDPQTVGIFDPGSSVFNPSVVNKSLTWDLRGRTQTINAPAVPTAGISYIVGQSAVGGITAATEPSVPVNYMKVARINLDASGGAIAALTDSMIVDMRRPLLPQGILSVSGQATIPGVLAGVGSEALNSVQLPPGVVLKAVLATAAGAGGVGLSYTMFFYIIGGDIRSSAAGNDGCVTANSFNTSARRMAVPMNINVGRLTAADVAILDGSDVNYTVVNTAASFGVGQPYAMFSLRVESPSGSALNNTESCFFTYTLALGQNS